MTDSLGILKEFKHWRIVLISVALTMRDCCPPKTSLSTVCDYNHKLSVLFVPLISWSLLSFLLISPCFSSVAAFPCLWWTSGAFHRVNVFVHGLVCAICLYFSHCCSFSVYPVCCSSKPSSKNWVKSLFLNVSLVRAFKSRHPWPINKWLALVGNVHSWSNQLP